MNGKRLYIIAGCNGAGKTTASFNMLPAILDCREFVNADEIARGISPFQPDKVAFEAGRIMLERIHDLMHEGVDFAFETTLSTRSFRQFVEKAKNQGYYVSLLFFWLESPELAIERVRTRVAEGGHDIPKATIIRRYHRGLKNLFEWYYDICNSVAIYDNSNLFPEIVSIRSDEYGEQISNPYKLKLIKDCI
jgi:predicted ABC-type ATPase